MKAPHGLGRDEPGKVVVIFDRFGPYHLARLVAAARRLNLLAVELCGNSQEYAWDVVEDAEGVQRTTLFPNTDSASITGAECRRRLTALLDAVQPSAVAVPGWSSPAALSALAWCGRNHRPAIIMSESTSWDEPRSEWKEAIKRKVVTAWASTGLVGGKAHADYLVELGLARERIFAGYDAVDNDYFGTESDRLRGQGVINREKLELPPRYFLASNRFIKKKNLERLLMAYASYRREHGEAAWSLVLIGDGPLRKELEARRAQLNLGKFVLLPGFKQYSELPLFYALAGGFIHASTTEQWGLVVNEAMASELPVLVSEQCGCAGDLVIEGENGWTFDPFQPESISKALHRLAMLPDEAREAMGKAARARIKDWSPAVFGEGLHQAVVAGLDVAKPRPGLMDRMVIETLLRR